MDHSSASSINSEHVTTSFASHQRDHKGPPSEPKRPVLKERKPLFIPDEATCGYAPAAYGMTG